MLNEETYENLWDVLRTIPSLKRPDLSVTEEIFEFDHAHPTHDVGRLIDATIGVRDHGPNDYEQMQFSQRDRFLLSKLMLMPESRERELDDISITEWFATSPHFFTTNFWSMWKTTFAFLEVDSVMELRRYMNRMILEFSRINTLEGVTRTPYNQYESIILPMRAWLSGKGVKFVGDRKITAFEFKDTPLRDEIAVTGLRYEDTGTGAVGVIAVDEDDFVFDTNGSITDSAAIGDFDTPITEDHRFGPSAELWKQATEYFYGLGHPDKFLGDRTQSEWLSFTITTDSHLLINEISRITKQRPGNALNTFVDSTACLSIVVHHQPHYRAQKPNEGVLWGYFLYPRRSGDFVHKPAIEMTGREVLTELLGHLATADKSATGIAGKTDEIVASIVNVIPCHMPYASAMFNRRAVGDRPAVVPANSKNLAFISQWCEMPFDMVFTEQYSVRAAQVAVDQFLGIPESRLTPLHHYEKDPRVLAKAAATMFR